MKITGTLIKTYKSFEKSYSFELEGNLVILSGINGSGKSQLLDIIRQKNTVNKEPEVSATLKLNGSQLIKNDTAYRSFKENISLPQFQNADPNIINNTKNQISQLYSKNRLSQRSGEMSNLRKSYENARSILITNFGIDDFTKGRISHEQIMSCNDLNSLIWHTDNIFANIISEVFFDHAKKVLHKKAKFGTLKDIYTEGTAGTAPWIDLNNFFKAFKLPYRFKKNYFIQENGITLNENPQLFQLTKDGKIDDTQARELNDLSDGEKAIISLAFGSLSGIVKDEKKVLLFDEFDATLNPSLTHIFFKILEEHFLSEGVMVIIATHSPATISLAPDNARFYEVFPASASTSRILPVQKNEYAELKIANKHFYTEISNQAERITYLEEQEASLEQQKENLKSLVSPNNKPVILFEGPIDVQYVTHAFELLGKKDTLNKITIDIVGEYGPNGTNNSGNKSLISARSFLESNPSVQSCKVVLFHDPENGSQEENINSKLYIRKMQQTPNKLLSSGIEHLFPNSLIEKLELAHKEYFRFSMNGGCKEGFKIKKDRKNSVCDWICEHGSSEDFEEFKNIIKTIEDFI